MKFFLAAALLLSSSAVLAMPTVGDVADFDATVVQNGQTFNGDYSMQITAFDTTAQQYNVRTTTAIGGQTQTQDTATPANQLLTDSTVAAILANCAAQGGTAGTLATAAGTFDTCALPISGTGYTGTAWVANVTFGFAQIVQNQTNGQVVTITLKSFQAGAGAN